MSLENNLDVQRFLETFSEETIGEIIQELTKNTQSKFKVGLSDEELNNLMLELRAVKLLDSLFLVWKNEAWHENEGESEEEVNE